MNSIEKLQSRVQREVDGVTMKLRRPRKPDGTWVLDATSNGTMVAIEWSPKRGFGVSASAFGDGYGEGPDETFEDAKEAEDRVVQLLLSGGSTLPPQDVLLRELRAQLGVTQEKLAERLGVQQAAVSRLERREEITLGSLKRYVDALGAQLEINVRTPTGEVLRLLSPVQSKRGVACEHTRVRGKRSERSGSPPVARYGFGTPLSRSSLWDADSSRSDASFASSASTALSVEAESNGLKSWFVSCVSAARSKWSFASSSLTLKTSHGGSWAYCDSETGSVSIDLDEARAIAGRLRACRSEHSEASWHRVARYIVAHEVGHFVDYDALRKEEFLSEFVDPELRADAVAGWLAGYLGEERCAGARLLGHLGCQFSNCTHPSPEERTYAFVAGHVVGSYERRPSPTMSLVVIRCSNLDESRNFYSRLGFELATEKHGNGPTHYSFKLADTVVELYPCRGNDGPSQLRLAFRLPDPLAALKALRADGTVGATKVRVTSEDPKAYVVNDPDGNVVELKSALTSAPHESARSSMPAGDIML